MTRSLKKYKCPAMLNVIWRLAVPCVLSELEACCVQYVGESMIEYLHLICFNYPKLNIFACWTAGMMYLARSDAGYICNDYVDHGRN
jgi:hypothetical protein